MGIKAFIDWLAQNPLTLGFLTLLGQLWLNRRFKLADEKRDEARSGTEKKRQEEQEWRNHMDRRMDDLDNRVDEILDTQGVILDTQCAQTRSDILHKVHRYIDDLGCASIEEKSALKAEHQNYQRICKENDIENEFIDGLVEQVMNLPSRSFDSTREG